MLWGVVVAVGMIGLHLGVGGLFYLLYRHVW